MHKFRRLARETFKSIPGPHNYSAGDAAGGATPSESDSCPSDPHQRNAMSVDTHSGGVHKVLGAWHSSEPSLCGTRSALEAAAAPDM
eukprot:3970841-Amphidinium_carterae.1